MAEDGGKGASESLNLTISEIMQFLRDGDKRPKSNLRPFLYEKIGDLAAYWFKRGFNRGHKESYKEFVATGDVGDVLKFDCSRKLSPDQKRALSLKSKIKKKAKKTKIRE